MLAVSAHVARALDTAFEAALPSEACGFLLGTRCGGTAVATRLAVPRGAAGSNGSFEIADYELRRMQAWGEERGLEIVALFHSHPSGDAKLSAADRASLAYSPWPWVIVTREPKGRGIVLSGYRPAECCPIKIQTRRRRTV